MAAQHVAAVEAQQQVFSDRLHGEQPAPVQAFGDALDRCPRVRSLDSEPLADDRL